jgi:hypothetical protein
MKNANIVQGTDKIHSKEVQLIKQAIIGKRGNKIDDNFDKLIILKYM